MFTFVLIKQEHAGRCLKEMEATHWTILNGKSFLLQNRKKTEENWREASLREKVCTEAIYLGVRQSYSFQRSKITAFLHEFSYM